MKIHFERTGGFMGLRMVATIDTDDLPEDEAATLRRLLDEVDFYDLPARLESPDPAMDQFHYVLTVSREEITTSRDVQGFWNRFEDEEEDEGDRARTAREEAHTSPDEDYTHTVTFTDAAAPREMLPLLRMLTRMAHGE